MTKTKTPSHTPGPWHTGSGNGVGSIFADEGRMRYENGTVLYPICVMNTGYDTVEDEMNARLVAAAPELLEALNSMMDAWVAECRATPHALDGHPQARDIHAQSIKARAMALEAIKKATKI